MSGQTTPLRVTEIRYEAAGVSSYILRREDGMALPCAAPGSHVDLHLPNGLVRSYSISNANRDHGAYRLTVAHKPAGVGSKYLREAIRVGDTLAASEPKNNFPLAEQADLSIFIAGGIGITPFMPMMAALNSAGRRWRLIYCAKTADSAPLRDEVEQLGSTGFGEVAWHLTAHSGGPRLDLKAAVTAGAAAGAHLYCCGPNGMLSDFLAAVSLHGLRSDQVHVEYFANETEAFTEGGFTVVLHRSGKELVVKSGQTILEAVEAAGVEVPQSCLEGLCGSCETAVLEGVPDHRDMVLSERDKQAGRTMMICCSGAKTGRLVLDL